MSDNSFLKTIWFLWLQGMNDAPLVVTKCYASWVKHNPDWKIIFLDETNFKEYAIVNHTQISKQAFSDILRINLLKKYGGVWVDATCFCVKPLNEWLPNYMDFGFFAFERPGPDRMISSWFLASGLNNHITITFQQVVENYWNKNPGLVYVESSKWKFLRHYLRQSATETWFSFLITKVLKVYPYFWFHYLFEKTYLRDELVKQLWDSVPKISADMPHGLQSAGLFNQLTDSIKKEIDHQVAPCYKLMWNYQPQDLKEGTILDYLINASAI